MQPNSWMAPPPPAGWYPDPDDDREIRYWDGTTWTRQPQFALGLPGAVVDDHPVTGSPEASRLIVIVGVCLILVALLFGFIAAMLLSDGLPGWAGDPYAMQFAETIWHIYFGAMLTLCVIAYILGVLCLVRPETHLSYSVIAGVLMILIGLAGCVLGFAFTDSIDPLIGYAGSGFLLALGGAITTLLSAIALARRRRSSRTLASAGSRPVGLPPGN